MGIFGALFGRGKRDPRFVNEAAFRQNLAKQVQMAPHTLAKLREYGVTEEKQRRLDFFFYSNQGDNVSALAEALKDTSASVASGPSADDPGVFLAQGQSVPVAMTDAAVVEWVRQMTRLGYEHDCAFDGWGTDPEQG